jgi:two-component system phosphate regulon sensor histidine kinase PhoR
MTPIIWNGAVIGASCVFRDITKEIEVDRAKSEFVSFASHQLRTPLHIVGLSSSLLQEDGGLFAPNNQAEAKSYIRDIQEATQQMNNIINNLLNVSRIESQMLHPVFETVAIEMMIARNLKEMAPQIKKKRLTVKTRFPQQTSQCDTDPHILQIVLQNLISNAIKYTPERGTIDIAVTQEKTHVVLVISDTGYGIPEDEQGNIFKKLYRASNARQSGVEGSGLGLYIVKAMIDKLDGDISFVSKEDQGTTFIVRIPVNKKPDIFSFRPV